MAELVEWYIACNPPLRPKGVSEVIRRVQDAEGLLEMLYEPDAPWFKCIALASQRQQITAAIQDNLFAIADDDVDILNIEEKTDGDVSIISPDPRMTPWFEYNSKGSEAYPFSDADVYPEPIAEAKYKTVWRGLEEYPDTTFQQLLARCSALDDRDFPHNQDQFEYLTKCTISHNLRQTVLYIGSDESRETVSMAVAKLNSIMQVYETDWQSALPRLLPALEIIPAALMKKPVSSDSFDMPSDINASPVGGTESPPEPIPAAELTKPADDSFDDMPYILSGGQEGSTEPSLEVMPAAEMTNSASNDPFDDIPSEVNASLEGSIEPCFDPFSNSQSLI